MDWLGFIVIAIFIFAIAILGKNKKRKASAVAFEYVKKDALFTQAECLFFDALNRGVDGKARIFGKVRVADVISPRPKSGNWYVLFNKISAKHFDFVLCNKTDFRILCVVELNDRSHNKKERRERDVFLENVCRAANVPLVQIKARSEYDVNEIKRLFAPYLSERVEAI